MVSFSGASYVVMGYIALRQGKLAEALELLVTGLEALRDSDPQQMFRFCAAMAYYVAAAQGFKAEADRLRSDYEAWGERGMHLVTAFAGISLLPVRNTRRGTDPASRPCTGTRRMPRNRAPGSWN